MTEVKDPQEAANEYVETHQFTHVGGEMERVAREVARVAFLEGAAWQRKDSKRARADE